MAHVLITDKINDLAVNIVSKVADVDNLATMDEDKLCEIIGNYDAILIRSQTKITSKVIDAAKNIKIIARAGVGVDNIDVNAATKKGIIVVNSPDGNTHAAAEHTIAMMMAVSRNIPVADASIKQGLWERSKFTGVEVFNKNLGVIGFGKIGHHVANVAMALGMKVFVYDPFSNKEIVEKSRATYIENLDDFWPVCDYITIHTPKTNDTTNLINKDTIVKMKKGVRIINCARGGIVNENDLCEAIKEGLVAGCAIDVFEDEKNVANSPLLTLGNKAILTPHLGASTSEAQINVAVDVASQVADVLSGKDATSAINIPALKPGKLEPVKDYMELCENIAQIAAQITEGSIKQIAIDFSGKLASLDITPLEIAILKGVLSTNVTGVNYVNTPIIAKERGIEVKSTKTNNPNDNIMVKIVTDNNCIEVEGTLIAKGIKRITKIDKYITSIEPKEHMLLVPHTNKPNMVALVSTVVGANNVNISGMQVVQNFENKCVSNMIINVDEALNNEILEKITKIDGVIGAKCINL